MDLYWMLEYGKVLCGYIVLMFLWPTVVFWKHLSKKSRIYHLSFCVLVQTTLISSIILAMGLFDILNKKWVICFFYGVFLISTYRIIRPVQFCILGFQRKNIKGILLYCRNRVATFVRAIWKDISTRILEYILLLIIVIFGMIYFSYGAFFVKCYGGFDVMTHHQWVNSLVGGDIFPNGIYPEAMHCFIYCLHVLFNIRIYSIMKFLQCIHIMVFFLSIYGLLREIFSWRYSPVFVLGLFLALDTNIFNCAYSIYRLQITLPMEFGLHTQFLCALFLVRYLKNADHIKIKRYFTRFYWDENLFLFMMSISASISIHYYTTIMAFVLCFSFVVFSTKKVFYYKYFVPLVISAICGCVIAGAPIMGALASGMSFEGSIDWGLKAINGDSGKNGEEQGEEQLKDFTNPLEPTFEDLEVVGNLPEVGQGVIKFLIRIEYFIKETARSGYKGMYGEKWGNFFFKVTIAVLVACFFIKYCFKKGVKKISCGYPPIILSSFISIIIYMAYAIPELELPVLISGNRYSAIAHMMVLAVMMIPVDIIFSAIAFCIKDYALQMLSYVFMAIIYIYTNICGIYHGYLYYSLTRYDSAVMVTNNILEKYPQGNFTIISPIEEQCQVALYGKHEEISYFIKKCEEEYYTIPTEYVYIYIEKRPIVYYQKYYFSGPRWLARSKESEIEATSISMEAAQKEMSEYESASWQLYMDGRIILESKAYEWCQQFLSKYPNVLKKFYEDSDFVCYYFEQDTDRPYNLAGDLR